MKRDDFTGNSLKRWWRNDLEGTATAATVNDGVLLLELQSADNTIPWCNTSIWDGHNMYGDVTVTMRIRAFTPARPGSRGGGLWYTTALNQATRQAWFMEVGDDPSYPDYSPEDVWWRASVANMFLMPNTWLEETDLSEDILQWHNYKIVRDQSAENEFIFYIDGNQVFQSEVVTMIGEHLSVQIWNDNLVYHTDPLGYYRRVWSGGTPDQLIVDYVEVLTEAHPDSSVLPSGNILLKEIPTEIGDGRTNYLWKNYLFNSPGGNCAVLVTARAEQYGSYGEDDDIKIILNGQDYGWDTPQSFNGAALDGLSRTVLINTNLASGTRNLQILGDQTPLLYDVTVLGAANGGIILDDPIDSEASGGNNQLFRSYNFLSHAGEITIFVSGSADEDPTPTSYGRYESYFNDDEDDDLRIVLDGNNYGWQTSNSLWGNRLYGESKAIVISENLTQGSHTLQLYTNGTPRVHRILIYGENDDQPLPVTLSSFMVSQNIHSNVIKWETESEINNAGFNLYKAKNNKDTTLENLSFFKLNQELIPGFGNSNVRHYYQFEDQDVESGLFYWYQLEDVDFNGISQKHEILRIYRNIEVIEDFLLYQNYPNPFNNYTTIEFGVSSPSQVRISVFNVSGQVVSSTDLFVRSSGNYKYIWDGKGFNGIELPSGVYFYQVLTDFGTQTKKLLLLK